MIKDGGSTDSVEEMVLKYSDERIRFVTKQDQGIYDAMNQAASLAEGKYVYFLNCGDTFYSEKVLFNIKRAILQCPSSSVFYGDIEEIMTGQKVSSNPSLDAFGCYRNVPCHQACYYKRELIIKHPFQTEYKVRADYEQFLWCFFEADAKPYFVNEIIAKYEGGGFSETKESLTKSKSEHKKITAIYMSRAQLLKYKLIMFFTFSGLRTWISKNPITAGAYQKIKTGLYHRK